jgi:hypothetical protein
MSTGIACPAVFLQVFLNNGQFASGGSVLTQIGGVNAATYQDVGLTTPLPNPIPLNSRGEVSNAAGQTCQLFLTPNVVYVFTFFDANGNSFNTASYVNGSQLTAAAIGALLYPQTAAELAASVTPTNYTYPFGYLRRYGAVGDGVTVDLPALQSAFAVVIAAGSGAIYGTAGDVYYLGTLTSAVQTNLCTVASLKNCVFYGNGCTIKTNTNVAGAFFGRVLSFTDPSNVALRDIFFTDSGFDQSQKGSPNWQASHSIVVTTSGTANTSGFRVEDCVASTTGSLFAAIQGGGGRISGIRLTGATLNCTYGPNFQENGDDVTIDHYVLNPVRAYFPYGVTNHDVNLHVNNDGTNANAGANALIEIKRYQNDTRAIKARVTVTGALLPWGCIYNLETQPNTGTTPAVMDSIDMDIRLSNSTTSSGCYPLQIRSYNQAGVLQNPTGDTFSRLTLRGDFGNWNIATVLQPVNIASVPGTTRGQLAFPPGMFHPQTVYAQVFPGFEIQTKSNAYLNSMLGNLTVANTGACDARTIDLTNYNGTTYILKVRINAVADVTLGSTSQTYAEYTLVGFVTGSAVTVSSNNVDISHTAGTASVLSWSTTGTFIQLALTNYNGANACLRMEIEHPAKFL